VARGLPAAPFYCLLLFAALPSFAGGLFEDLTASARPLISLLLTLVTATAAFAWLGAQLYRSDVWWLDAAFRYWPLSLAGTLFAIAGLAHAMNIIDGSHGLCAGVGVIVLSALAVVAQRVGADSSALAAGATAAAFVGFLLFNYPLGMLFLGDGGAYLLGVLVGIVSARLVGRYPATSPWFPFALVVYPVWETLFSALRRLATDPGSVGRPDALHLHSLIRQRLRQTWFPGRDQRSLKLSNALTAIPLWLMQGAMAWGAVQWYDRTHVLIALSLGFVPAYCVLYWWVRRSIQPAL